MNVRRLTGLCVWHQGPQFLRAIVREELEALPLRTRLSLDEIRIKLGSGINARAVVDRLNVVPPSSILRQELLRHVPE